jgi:hypothetical protein
MLLIGIPPSIEAGPAYPKISTGFAGIADLLRVLEHSKLALNVAFVMNTSSIPNQGNYRKCPESPYMSVVRVFGSKGVSN